MREYQKRHQHHRHPRRRRGEAWDRSYSAELQAPGKFRRRFATRDERIARLATYLGELRSEAQAVEEQIAELKSASGS
jgi:hypothetical protein